MLWTTILEVSFSGCSSRVLKEASHFMVEADDEWGLVYFSSQGADNRVVCPEADVPALIAALQKWVDDNASAGIKSPMPRSRT